MVTAWGRRAQRAQEEGREAGKRETNNPILYEADIMKAINLLP